MKHLILALLLSLLLLSCKKDPSILLPELTEEAKIKPNYQHSSYYELDGMLNKCTDDTVFLSGTLYYNSSFTQTSTLYTSDYSASFDSLAAIGKSGRIYKVTGVRTKHLEADVEGDALTLKTLDVYTKITLTLKGGRNDYIYTGLSQYKQPDVITETCK